MFDILRKFKELINHIDVLKYESEENQIRVHVKLLLKDNSRLILRDYKFSDNTRKYSYHWMDSNGKLKVRWDNVVRYHTISTFPDHKHVGSKENVLASTETDMESVLTYIKDQIA